MMNAWSQAALAWRLNECLLHDLAWCINVNCAVKHIRVKLRHESGCTGLIDCSFSNEGQSSILPETVA